jgi:putative chitinase
MSAGPINRKYYFDSVRGSLFSGHMNQDQVDGQNALLDWNEQLAWDDRWLAYLMATTYHETALTMQPIAEYGKGKGKPYGVPDGPYNQIYYGRGFVQLTWYDNYVKQDAKLGFNGALVRDADRALDLVAATKIIFGGMADGDFTGVGLPKYINDSQTDFYNARKIVNGLDQASTIQGYAVKFLNAITHLAGVANA